MKYITLIIGLLVAAGCSKSEEEKLTSEISSLEVANKSLEAEIKAWRSAQKNAHGIEYLAAEIKSWRAQKQNVNKWLVEAEGKIEDLEWRLKEAGKMNQDLREQVTKLKADIK